MLRVSTAVAFCAALIGGGAMGAKAEITASVPAGVHWSASPEGMPLWVLAGIWPGSQVSRSWFHCSGSRFWVTSLFLALGAVVGATVLLHCGLPVLHHCDEREEEQIYLYY